MMSEINPEPSPLAPEISPLTEADPLAVNILISSRLDSIFNKNPLELTDEDIRLTVEYYRKERARFITESQAKEAAGPRVKKTPPKSVAEVTKTFEITPISDLF
jgi:DUF438 domain-containing protein